jgi:hypothetical protein
MNATSCSLTAVAPWTLWGHLQRSGNAVHYADSVRMPALRNSFGKVELKLYEEMRRAIAMRAEELTARIRVLPANLDGSRGEMDDLNP